MEVEMLRGTFGQMSSGERTNALLPFLPPAARSADVMDGALAAVSCQELKPGWQPCTAGQNTGQASGRDAFVELLVD